MGGGQLLFYFYVPTTQNMQNYSLKKKYKTYKLNRTTNFIFNEFHLLTSEKKLCKFQYFYFYFKRKTELQISHKRNEKNKKRSKNTVNILQTELISIRFIQI